MTKLHGIFAANGTLKIDSGKFNAVIDQSRLFHANRALKYIHRCFMLCDGRYQMLMVSGWGTRPHNYGSCTCTIIIMPYSR